MRRLSERSGRVIDGLSGDATNDDPFARWIGGVLFASMPLVIGMLAIVNASTLFVGGRPIRVVRYNGQEAIALGVAWIGAAAFMHAHYFWTVSHRFYFISEILKPAALLTIGGGMGYVVVHFFLYT